MAFNAKTCSNFYIDDPSSQLSIYLRLGQGGWVVEEKVKEAKEEQAEEYSLKYITHIF